MRLAVLPAVIALFALTAAAQASSSSSLAPGTTLPIQFDRNIDSSHVHIGDAVTVRTTQQITLANGQTLPSGTRIVGHVVDARGFTYDKTPYAKQQASTLQIRFDSLESQGKSLPLHVYVRAMADPLSVWDTQKPKSSDLDSLGTLTLIGGDQLVPSQSEITSQQGDVVGYLKRGGVYAHLLSSSGHCDEGNTEQAMGRFSASACGLYGYTDVSMLATGRDGEPSTLVLASHRHSAKIWAKSAALLEVMADE